MKTSLHQTRNDLPETMRRKVVDLLHQKSAALAKFGATARGAIEAATKAGDADTADLFTGVSRGVDKLLWLVEAHAQSRD